MAPVVYARVTTWKWMPGKRAEAVKIVEEHLEDIRKSKGFRGLITMLPSDDPNGAMFMAIWDSQEDLVASQKGVYSMISTKAMPLAEGPPSLKNVEIPRALLALI